MRGETPHELDMTIHLIKLSVGPESLAELESWQKQRLKTKKELIHITRNTPKRKDELLKGGSIYWVIKGWLVARQKLIELRPMTYEGTPHCGIVYDKEFIRVQPRPHRAFQGWRYLEGKDAPKDLANGKGIEDMPEEMVRELTALGLL